MQPNPVVLFAHHKPCPFSQLFWFLLNELVFLILNICLWQPSSEIRLHVSVLWLKLSYGVLKQSLPFLFSLNESVKEFYDLTVPQVSVYCDHCTILEDPRVLQTVLVIWFFGMSQIYSSICQERRVQMLVLSTVEHYRSVYTGLCWEGFLHKSKWITWKPRFLFFPDLYGLAVRFVHYSIERLFKVGDKTFRMMQMLARNMLLKLTQQWNPVGLFKCQCKCTKI